MRKVILLIFLFNLICLFSFAETIIFKSGKVVEAKIVERTDEWIKVDFQGVHLTYYLEDIENIDREENFLQWQEWHPYVEEYIVNTASLIFDIGDVIAKHMEKIHHIILPETKKELFTIAQQEIFVIGQKIKSLSPPLDLSGYYKEITEAWGKVNNFYTNNSNYTDSELKEIGRQVLLSQIDIVKEVKDLFIKHGAPEDYIESQDSLIENLLKLLGKYEFKNIQ